ncbi:MAG: GNAT family N-acetyltransferase [Chloroflexi bacterium]|nr:GNAT family N-acetyltransferase [Chloroflexota bacterium]
MVVEPVTLMGRHVRLEPLNPSHAEDLLIAGRDPEVWTYMPRHAFETLEDVKAWIAWSLEQAAKGTDSPFAIINLVTGKAVGSTRFMDIATADRRLEIGWTWLAREAWQTPVNTECKYLLLRHAFEVLGCLRVQLKTDLRNTRSQQAIERLGAVKEGVLRKHVILKLKGDYQRSSVMYSIIDTEWPAAKARLEAKMGSMKNTKEHEEESCS